jgi:NTE family protein
MVSAKPVDAVFEGGGVKGIGLVGAVEATVEHGYRFQNVAGTSAGAIVAALVAAGYTPAELKSVLQTVDYSKFLDKDFVDKIPIVGPALSVVLEKGIYAGRYLEEWLRELLAAKGKRTFSDLILPDYEQERYRYRLQVIAADVSRGKLLKLPWDIRDYGENPDDLEIARAVRMSASIPFFFEPIEISAGGETCYVVDGGVLSNFPVWLFDSVGVPEWPTFGYKLVDPSEGRPHTVTGPLTLLSALFSTMMEAHDARYIEDKNFVRTICIPTLGVRTTEFDITPPQKDALYQAGRKAASDFFATWSFEHYKERYRRHEAPSRRQRV